MDNWLKALVAGACCVVIAWGAAPIYGYAASYLRGLEANRDSYNSAVASMSSGEQTCRNTADDAARKGYFPSKETKAALQRCYKDGLFWPVARQSLEDAGLWGDVTG